MLKGVTKQFSIVSIIVIGSLSWILTMIRSGIKYSYGYGFWGANSHDGIWHIALAESLSRGTLDMPVFSGQTLKNYHLGFDLFLVLINKITSISIVNLYFQVLPPIFAVLIGYLVYLFVLNWRNSKYEALWATAFVYFSCGFGFVVTLLRDGVATGESMFWSQQSTSTLVNPPFALSLIFILSGLIALQKKNTFLSILFFGLLIQIKAYAAILVLGALFVTSLYSYYREKSKFYSKVFVGSLLLNLFLFVLIKNDGLSSFVWQPFWFLETMMSYSDRVGWDKFYSAMTTYKMGHIWIKGFLAYSIAFLIFVIGNMGVRIVGFYFLIKQKFENISVFLLSIVGAGVLIPTFFVQRGTPWNSIQFFYYYLFFFSIFAGIATSWIKGKSKYILFVVFAIFGAWSTLQHYLSLKPQAIISSSEVEALNFLRVKPAGIVFTYSYDKYKAQEAIKNPPRSLYVYDSTAYVSAFSNKQVFLEDEVNLNIVGYNWNDRRLQIENFIINTDPEKGRQFLSSNNIKYLYLVKKLSPLPGELFKLGEAELGLVKIFDNKDYIIYQYGEDFGSYQHP